MDKIDIAFDAVCKAADALSAGAVLIDHYGIIGRPTMSRGF